MRKLLMLFGLLWSPFVWGQATPIPSVGLYYRLASDPTVGAGAAAPLGQILFRTDVPSIYWKSGTGATNWTLLGSSAAPTGSGTANKVTKWLTASTIGDTAFPITDGASALTIGDNTSADLTTLNGRLVTSMADATAANALLSTNSSSNVATDTAAISAVRSGTSDATGATRTNRGAVITLSTTKSAGANSVNNNGIEINSSGGDANRGARISVTGSGTTNTGTLITNTSTATTNRGVDVSVTGAGTTNVAALLTATGAGTNRALQCIDGEIALGTTSGNVCIGSTGCSSKLSVTGAATVSSTLGVTGDFSVNTNKFTANATTGNIVTAGSTTTAGLINSGSQKRTGVQTDTSTGTVNDFVINDGVTRVRFNPGSTLTINGFKCGSVNCDSTFDGTTIEACDIATSISVVITYDNASASANNRILANANATTTLTSAGTNANACAQFTYDGTSLRWRQSAMHSSSNATINGTFQAGSYVAASTSGYRDNGTDPTLSSCGGSPTVVGGNSFMRVTTGSAATACTITFSGAWAATPACLVEEEATGNAAIGKTVSTTAITLTVAAASTVYVIHCGGTQ